MWYSWFIMIQPISVLPHLLNWIIFWIEFFWNFFNWIIFWIEFSWFFFNQKIFWIEFCEIILNWILNWIIFWRNSNIELNQFGYRSPLGSGRWEGRQKGCGIVKESTPCQHASWLRLHREEAANNSIILSFCCRDVLSYGLNTLGPLCLWQCFLFHFSISCSALADLSPKLEQWNNFLAPGKVAGN